MRQILISVSLVGLTLTVVPSLLVMLGKIAWTRHADLMLLGMILWFATAPFWMKSD